MDENMALTPIPTVGAGLSNYLVDTVNGRVWSKKTKKWMTSKPNSNGYVYNTIIDDDGVAHSLGVHRIVMASHTGIPLEQFKRGLIEIDHLDEELTHVNGISNLQMSTRKGQYKPSTRARMSKPRPRLGDEQVCEILEQLAELRGAEGFKMSEFIKQMCDAYGKHYRTMWSVCTGRSYRHLYKAMENGDNNEINL